MPAVDQRGAALDLACNVGDDWSLSVTVTENSVTWSATGATVTSTIINAQTGAAAGVASFTTAVSDGVLSASLTDTQTTTLGVGTYRYAIEVTKASVTRTWLAGTFTVSGATTPGRTSSSAAVSITNGTVTLGITSTTGAAANITLADSAGYFVATSVENAARELALSDKRYAPSPFSAFKNRLDLGGLGGPLMITCMGDSTSNDSADWFYRFLESVATAFPSWAVQHRLWSDTAQSYLTPTFVQAGTAGQGYLTPGASPGTATAADSAAVSVTNADLLVRARCRVTTFAAATNQAIASQYGGVAGNRGWRFYFSTSGSLVFEYSADGTALVSSTIASAGQVTTAFTAGTDIYVGVSFTRNNGSNSVAQAITSTNGTSWTNFGTAVNNATITSIFDTTQGPEVGGRSGGGDALGGRVYWVDVFKGTDATTSTLAWRFDASLYDSGTTFVDGEGKTWTLGTNATITRGAPVLLAMNGSVAGQGLTYFDNATRRPLMLCAPSDVVIVNTGHNEGTADFGSTMSTFITNAVALQPNAGIVICKQNPESTTATNYRRHARSMMKLGAQATQRGWGVIDAFQAFQDTGTPDTYVGAADVHPTTPAGDDLWRDEALRSFGLA